MAVSSSRLADALRGWLWHQDEGWVHMTTPSHPEGPSVRDLLTTLLAYDILYYSAIDAKGREVTPRQPLLIKITVREENSLTYFAFNPYREMDIGPFTNHALVTNIRISREHDGDDFIIVPLSKVADLRPGDSLRISNLAINLTDVWKSK